MTRQQVFAVCFLAILLILLYQVYTFFRPFLMPILWAMILAHLMFPVHDRFGKLLGGREALSASLMTLAIMLIVVLPVVMLSIVLVDEAIHAQKALAGWIEAGGIKRLPDLIAGLPVVGGTIEDLLKRAGVSQDNFGEKLAESVAAMKTFVVREGAVLAMNLIQLVVDFLIMIIVLFVLLKDGRDVVKTLHRIIPLQPSHKDRIFARVDKTVRAVVKGIVITALAQGLLAGLAYGVLGVPFATLLTAMTAVVAPFPIGGAALVWLPVSLYLFWVGPAWQGIAMIVWGAGVVTMVDNFLKPILIGQEAQLPLVLLLFSLLGGLAAYGLIGLFLGPVILGLLLTALEIYEQEYLRDEASS
jgi:predicted PurR-regulated permease PerM